MKKRLFWFIAPITLLFCIAISFDISPYLRGPSPYPPEWRWDYLFVNTLSRLYLPLGVLLLFGLLYWWIEKKKTLQNESLIVFFVFAIVFFFLFQFCLLFFSRAGIGVLIHRIINPELNSYFTAALTIQSVPDFLNNYNTQMLHFIYHARSHPPGSILFFYSIDQIMGFFPQLGEWATQQVPQRIDVRMIWETLRASEKATVFVSAIIISLISSLSIIPLYFTSKLLYGKKSAIRSVFLFSVIPSLMFFIPINDAFLHIFSITGFCFFVYGLHKNNSWLLIFSGIVMFIGAFFNLSLLPVVTLFFVYFLLHERNNLEKKRSITVLTKGSLFFVGLLVPFLLLFVFFQFNFITMTIAIIKDVPHVHTRSYTIWIFYNLYDFFVFTGIPVTIVYFTTIKITIQNFLRKRIKQIDLLLIVFTVMILVVNFSGSVRGETGRIWIPYVPFIVLIVSGFLTKTVKLSTKQFAVVLGLQALQIVVMQEFWVMLW